MNIKKLVTIVLGVCILPLLPGCLFKIGSAYNYEYPIQSDGTINLTLAPLEDIQNFTLIGFYPPLFGENPIEIYCEGQLVTLGPPGWGAINGLGTEMAEGVFELHLDLTSAPFNSCITSYEGAKVTQLAIRIGDRYAPILSTQNGECIENKIHSEGENYIVATKNCIELDSRTTVDPFGFNLPVATIALGYNGPREINKLRIYLPPT